MLIIELLLAIIGLLLALQTAIQAQSGPRLALMGGWQMPAPELWELARLRAQIGNVLGGANRG